LLKNTDVSQPYGHWVKPHTTSLGTALQACRMFAGMSQFSATKNFTQKRLHYQPDTGILTLDTLSGVAEQRLPALTSPGRCTKCPARITSSPRKSGGEAAADEPWVDLVNVCRCNGRRIRESRRD